MKRGTVYSLAGLLLVIGLFVGCGVPEANYDTADVKAGQAQSPQSAASNTRTAIAGEVSSVDLSQPSLFSGTESDPPYDFNEALSCTIVKWQIPLCNPFSFKCTYTGSIDCCVSKCQEKCRSLCGIPSATCTRLCVF